MAESRKKSGKTALLILPIVCLSVIGYYMFLEPYCQSTVPEMPVSVLDAVLNAVPRSPWANAPDFVLYLRLTSGQRWEDEYNNVLIKTMRTFLPEERAKLVVVLDNEKEKDHELGEQLKQTWPHPEICYRDPGDPAVYHNWGKGRMFWDMMYPDACTNAPYVGFIDTDTFFSTLVTPNLLFEANKPIIVAKIGSEPYSCWVAMTEIFLKQKEVMQCMSTFPVMIKTGHLKKMREIIGQLHNASFDDAFRTSLSKGGGAQCLCQFSIMCNYVWYYHRDEYSWHLQMVPDGSWNGQNRHASQVPVVYYQTEVKPWMKVPIPRSTIHLRYTITNGVILDKKAPERHIWEDFIKEGLCYSAGFEYCPAKCARWNATKVHYNLYSFESYQWFWDDRCYAQQQKHYKHVRAYVKYSISQKKQIFGLDFIDNLCSIL